MMKTEVDPILEADYQQWLQEHDQDREACAHDLLTKAASLAELPEVVRAAARLEPTMRRRFLESVARAKGRINVDDLLLALRTGNQARVLETLRLVELEGDLKAGTSDTMRQAFLKGAAVGALALKKVHITLNFELMTPHAAQWAETQATNLSKRISTEHFRMIQDLVAESMRTGQTVDQTAREIRTFIGLHPRYAAAVARRRDELQQAGATEEKIDREVQAYSNRLLKARAEMIARTESNRAAMQGQRMIWDEAARNGLFNKQTTVRHWITTVDDLTCEICLDMDGEEVPYDEEFEYDGEAIRPSEVHPHCRCSEALIFDHGAKELKYSPDQPREPAGSPEGGQWTDGGAGTPEVDHPDFSDIVEAHGYQSGAQRGAAPAPDKQAATWTPEHGGTIFHGTSRAFNRWDTPVAYLTDDFKEAEQYAHGVHLGGGRGKWPMVMRLTAKAGKTMDVDAYLAKAMAEDWDPDDALKAAYGYARSLGARYVVYEHPSNLAGDQQQRVVVSLHPNEDLHLGRLWRRDKKDWEVVAKFNQYIEE